MKFTEAMERAFKNEGTEFIAGSTLMVVEDCMLIFKNKKGVNSVIQNVVSIDLERDWQPVPKEVDWQEAIRAYVFEGKTVKHVHDVGAGYTPLIRIFQPKQLSDFPYERIQMGHWYIVQEAANE